MKMKGENTMFFHKTKSSGVTAEIRVKRCYGCGAILQDQDPNEVGYIPKEKLESDQENLCERCYKLRHYSKYKASGDFTIDYVTILSRAKEENALVCYVLNAFSLEGSFLKGINKFLPERFLVIVNKRDLLPKDYSDEYIIDRVKEKMEKDGNHPIDIILTSSGNKRNNIDALVSSIEKNRNGKSVYFVGAYQVGKSSLINCLLMGYTNSTEKMITTSPYPGTTLDVISIPLDENSFLYDTPGIYNSSSIVSFVEPEIVKYVLPRSEVKPESYSSKEGQSFLLSNLARIDFVSGEKTTFTFYKSNDLTLQRCKCNKAESLFDSICSNVNAEVRSQKITSMSSMKKVTFHADGNDTARLVINGLLFVEFPQKGQTIDCYVPNPVDVSLESASVKK